MTTHDTSPSRLIYVSRLSAATPPGSLVGLVAQCARNNARKGLTGMLCFAEGNFLQLLEGPGVAVSRTFTRIAQDSRHHDVRLLSFEAVSTLQFPSFQMGFADVSGDQVLDAMPALRELGAGSPYAPFPLEAASAVAFLHAVSRRAVSEGVIASLQEHAPQL